MYDIKVSCARDFVVLGVGRWTLTGARYVHTLSMDNSTHGAKMAAAVQRIVVQATTQDKKAITAKAKRLGVPVSELMRRGAFAYEPTEDDEALGVLADAAKAAAERAGASIDAALEYVAKSETRIVAMEAAAKRSRRSA
jgi:creatinine amidohydrolase/Fe(II)-dependent formamide hydrolase-like protein